MRTRVGVVLWVLLLQSLYKPAFAGLYTRFAGDQNVTIQQGKTAVLNATPGAAGYQWYKNGQAITGATQRSYPAGASGRYYVVTYNVDGCSSQPSDGVNIVVTPSNIYADMAVNIIAVRSSDNMDDPFKYIISIKNNGVNDATSVKVLDQLPDAVELQQLLPPSKGTASASGKKITWNLDQMIVGQSADLSMIVKALKTGVIINQATVSANETDPNLNNNIDDVSTTTTALNIPNVFTPNGDGVNDVFVIPGLDSYTANELTIVNRWDATVYHKINYKNDWDGSGLNEGTYFYILKVQAPGGGWNVYKGYVTLLRARQ